MEEIREILKMVSDGVITVEEAERLIKAVGEGRDKPGETRETNSADGFGRRPGRGRRDHGGLAGNIGAAVFEGLSGLGGFIADTISQATSGLAGEWEDEDRGSSRAEELSLTGDGLEAPWARKILISVSGGDTVVKANSHAGEAPVPHESGSSGAAFGSGRVSSKFTFHDPEGNGFIRVYRSGETMIVRCSEGDLEAGIPAFVEAIKVKTTGGAVRVSGLRCRCTVRTMGGDVEINGCCGKIDAKTFGGRISLSLAQGFGQVRAATNGGDIEFRVPAEGTARIRATTLAGRITADSSVRAGTRRGGLVNTTAEFEAGAAGTGPLVELSTVAGNIRILGAANPAKGE